MTHKLTFTVDVTIDHESGRFASNDAIAEQITTALESAQDEFWRGLTVNDTDYKIRSWHVARTAQHP